MSKDKLISGYFQLKRDFNTEKILDPFMWIKIFKLFFCAVTTLGFHLFTSIVLACITVQSFSKDNLTTGHEQFKCGSVTGSEVKACTCRVDADQLMSADLPLSMKTVHISHNHCTDSETEFFVETDSSPE